MLSTQPTRALLPAGRRGIEKESLRVTRDGMIAFTPHPRALGSALTHLSLTTDYSEALLELITPPEHDAAAALAQLDELHRYVYASIGDELLWTHSIPGRLPADHHIPIANYGTSNIGRLKTVYRRGLAYRYGRTMQCIAGIHYNYSLDEEVWRRLRVEEKSAASMADYQSEGYLALIRNFHRTSWLLLYLFGASPTLDANFLRGRPHILEAFDADTLYLPYATSLRMSDFGYSNTAAQSALLADYNALQGYLNTLAKAVSEPYPAYEVIGTQRHGEWIQINTNILQIENEFYSTIRPKRVTIPGERPLHALASRGVQYIEVRCLDLDPFEPNGISLETARFLDAYLLACALDESPSLTFSANSEVKENFSRVALEGRKPHLQLTRAGTPIPMQTWANNIMEKVEIAGKALDAIRGDHTHAHAIAAQRSKLENAENTPSARTLNIMHTEKQSFLSFAHIQSAAHAAYFRAQPLSNEILQKSRALAEQSLKEQITLENENGEPFDAFMATYRVYTPRQFNT